MATTLDDLDVLENETQDDAQSQAQTLTFRKKRLKQLNEYKPVTMSTWGTICVSCYTDLCQTECTYCGICETEKTCPPTS